MFEEGQKFDAQKPRFSLIPKGVLAPVINVLEFGAQKYSEGNWARVQNSRSRYFDAAQRHLDAWWQGESKDVETGESHLAHAICCLMFLLAKDVAKTETLHLDFSEEDIEKLSKAKGNLVAINPRSDWFKAGCEALFGSKQQENHIHEWVETKRTDRDSFSRSIFVCSKCSKRKIRVLEKGASK
jgi:hypothetical protein